MPPSSLEGNHRLVLWQRRAKPEVGMTLPVGVLGCACSLSTGIVAW